MMMRLVCEQAEVTLMFYYAPASSGFACMQAEVTPMV